MDDALIRIWNHAAATIAAIPRSGLLMAMVAALLLGFVGSQLARREIALGALLRSASTLALVGILITVVLQISRFDPRLEVAMPEAILPKQRVEGGETRIPMASDGHFWLRAQVNGVEANFLVDTGATITGISQPLAERAGLRARRGGIPISIQTANGLVAAQLATIDEIRFGNIRARGLDAAIIPDMGDTNVLGMNLLSRLASWRVEGNTLILTPRAPDRQEALVERARD